MGVGGGGGGVTGICCAKSGAEVLVTAISVSSSAITIMMYDILDIF